MILYQEHDAAAGGPIFFVGNQIEWKVGEREREEKKRNEMDTWIDIYDKKWNKCFPHKNVTCAPTNKFFFFFLFLCFVHDLLDVDYRNTRTSK